MSTGMNIRRITDLLFRAATRAPLAGQAFSIGRDRDAERQYADLAVLPDSAWDCEDPSPTPCPQSPRRAVGFDTVIARLSHVVVAKLPIEGVLQ